jgi:2,4-dienoyl-CoA reductase (NADPH2)
MLDLVHGGSSWAEVEKLAKEIEVAGANIINTGIGWHEARIPTIATMVPRGGFAFVTKRLMGKINIPLITTNRFNDPEDCERALADGCADMISMARPFLADPFLMSKSQSGTPEKINTCIGCNQACLDHVFKQKIASCLVNPRACEEDIWPDESSVKPFNGQNIAVVGGGPAGMSCAVELAVLGFKVDIFEKATTLGGQFNVAKKIPGKSEFNSTIRYFTNRLSDLGVGVHLGTSVSAHHLIKSGYNHVVLASGVTPRKWNVPGSDRPEVVNYLQVLNEEVEIGNNVAIIGAGGIGFDVADFLTHDADSSGFLKSWGIDETLTERGGITKASRTLSKRKIFLLQRSPGKPGSKLGKTTGWIHRVTLRKRGVEMWSDVDYKSLDDKGLHLSHPKKGTIILPVDNVVVCAGQVPFAPLLDKLENEGVKVSCIGGAYNSRGLDAQRAIREGLKLASRLESELVS